MNHKHVRVGTTYVDICEDAYVIRMLICRAYTRRGTNMFRWKQHISDLKIMSSGNLVEVVWRSLH